MIGNIVTLAGPTAEPITLAEAKAYCLIDADITADDARIRGLIAAARDYVENFTGQQLMRATLQSYFDGFVDYAYCTNYQAWRYQDSIYSPSRLDLLTPLRAVTAITYRDEAGAVQTLNAATYVVDTASQPGSVMQAENAAWPATLRHPQAVTVNFTAGYAQAAVADAATDTLTATAHGYVDDDVVRLSNSGGSLPAPLQPKTDYYVVNATTDTLQLALTVGGAAIDLTDAGSETSYLGEVPDGLRNTMLELIGGWYERCTPDYSRINALLMPYKVWGAM